MIVAEVGVASTPHDRWSVWYTERPGWPADGVALIRPRCPVVAALGKHRATVATFGSPDILSGEEEGPRLDGLMAATIAPPLTLELLRAVVPAGEAEQVLMLDLAHTSRHQSTLAHADETRLADNQMVQEANIQQSARLGDGTSDAYVLRAG